MRRRRNLWVPADSSDHRSDDRLQNDTVVLVSRSIGASPTSGTRRVPRCGRERCSRHRRASRARRAPSVPPGDGGGPGIVDDGTCTRPVAGTGSSRLGARRVLGLRGTCGPRRPIRHCWCRTTDPLTTVLVVSYPRETTCAGDGRACARRPCPRSRCWQLGPDVDAISSTRSGDSPSVTWYRTQWRPRSFRTPGRVLVRRNRYRRSISPHRERAHRLDTARRRGRPPRLRRPLGR